MSSHVSYSTKYSRETSMIIMYDQFMSNYYLGKGEPLKNIHVKINSTFFL